MISERLGKDERKYVLIENPNSILNDVHMYLSDLLNCLWENPDIVASKVSSVVRELMQRRRYSTSGMSDEAILDDIENYYPQVLNMARYDYNTIGAEGEDRHTENGVDRTYTERNKMWSGVVPISRVF